MFITLLIVTFLIAGAVAVVVARWFAAPIQRILGQIVDQEITFAWTMYLRFAILVVGISSGVRVFQLERYISPQVFGPENTEILQLNRDRWVLEIYRTIIGTLQGIAARISVLQHGRIYLYLLYSFATLLALLMFVH